MRKLIFLLGGSVVFLLSACTTSRFCSLSQMQHLGAPNDKEGAKQKDGTGYICCNEFDSYIPDTLHLDHSPTKIVRINMHIMNKEDSSAYCYGKQAIEYCKGVVSAAQRDVSNNKKAALPQQANLPVLPVGYEYLLTLQPDILGDQGIYEHFDDDLYYYVLKGKNQNNYNPEVLKKYGIGTDSILNIFLMPQHPDSLANPKYRKDTAGIALGEGIKITGGWENTGNQPWNIRMVFNHEVGHVFSLAHSWAGDDGCKDTPNHVRCWNRSEEPPCNTNFSNNVMTYSALQNSWTPCQIGKIHYFFSLPSYRSRKYLLKTWCTRDPLQTITITDTITWKGMKDLHGDLIIASGGVLTLKCRTSMPPDSKIIVQPGGTLILDNNRIHNDCGKTWKGIFIERKGKSVGRVQYLGIPAIENVTSTVQ